MNELIYALLTVILPILAGILITYVKNAVAESKYAQAVSAVADAVYHTQQTYVDTLKKQGKFDEQAQRLAVESAIAVAESYMSNAVLKFVNKTFGAGWIENMIETVIGEMKHN